MKRKTAIFILLLTATLAAGCAKAPAPGTTPSAPPVETQQSDGSSVTTSEVNGIKSEVRSFPQGDIAQVSRASRPDGRRYVTIRFRDGRHIDLREPADIDRAIEATSEELTAFALKVPGFSNPPAESKGAKKETP